MSDILDFLPSFRRLAYLNALFEWLETSLQQAGHSTYEGYPQIPEELIGALKNLGEELGSTQLLRYCVHLTDLNRKIKAIRPNSHHAPERAMELLMDDLPRAGIEFRAARHDCLASAVTWLVGFTLIIIAASFAYELTKALARMFYDPTFF